MEAPTNVTSKQGIQKSTKIRNIPISFTHFVMQIMLEIYRTDDQLHKQFISSMVPSYTRVQGRNIKPQESFPMQKQEQCTQEC